MYQCKKMSLRFRRTMNRVLLIGRTRIMIARKLSVLSLRLTQAMTII
jgi:hypothetical protein